MWHWETAVGPVSVLCFLLVKMCWLVCQKEKKMWLISFGFDYTVLPKGWPHWTKVELPGTRHTNWLFCLNSHYLWLTMPQIDRNSIGQSSVAGYLAQELWWDKEQYCCTYHFSELVFFCSGGFLGPVTDNNHGKRDRPISRYKISWISAFRSIILSK